MIKLDPKCFTKNSWTKISILNPVLDRYDSSSPHVRTLMDKMAKSGSTRFELEHLDSNIDDVRNEMISFWRSVNSAVDSEYIRDITGYKGFHSCVLKMPGTKVSIRVLYPLELPKPHEYIGTIVHVTATFLDMFPANSEHVDMFISLDMRSRDLDHSESSSIQSRFQHYKKKSTALNASGMTNRGRGVIFLTKTEEIVKLLFHELIHYAGLDNVLLGNNLDVPWDLSNKSLNTSEAYTEALSIILTTMYQSFQYGNIKGIRPIDMFHYLMYLEQNYSIQMSANVLYFYGYNNGNYREFFNSTKMKHSCPIHIFPYVLLRTFLLNKYVELISALGGDLKLTSRDIVSVHRLLKPTDEEITLVGKCLIDGSKYKNISYMVTELDWAQI